MSDFGVLLSNRQQLVVRTLLALLRKGHEEFGPQRKPWMSSQTQTLTLWDWYRNEVAAWSDETKEARAFRNGKVMVVIVERVGFVVRAGGRRHLENIRDAELPMCDMEKRRIYMNRKYHQGPSLFAWEAAEEEAEVLEVDRYVSVVHVADEDRFDLKQVFMGERMARSAWASTETIFEATETHESSVVPFDAQPAIEALVVEPREDEGSVQRFNDDVLDEIVVSPVDQDEADAAQTDKDA